jgi:hypothetical protein
LSFLQLSEEDWFPTVSSLCPSIHLQIHKSGRGNYDEQNYNGSKIYKSNFYFNGNNKDNNNKSNNNNNNNNRINNNFVTPKSSNNSNTVLR